ncbi:MAG TPA: TraR/DksA C4-type zinc finger protein [Actinomycetota bacterium]|nr:TraR/DksA C4-type zinc finger protein [Actinomycetota bacterium]
MDINEARTRLEEERGRLLGARSELESEVKQERAGGEDGSELSSVDQHPADQATETFEREKDLSILESTDEQLRDIELAFARIDDGSYGTCEVCGRLIGEERLRAKPAARLCIDHQRESEQGPDARSGRL